MSALLWFAMIVPSLVKVVWPMPRLPLPWMVCPLPMVSRSPEVLAKMRLFSEIVQGHGPIPPSRLTLPLRRRSIPVPALAKVTVPLLVNVPTNVVVVLLFSTKSPLFVTFVRLEPRL